VVEGISHLKLTVERWRSVFFVGYADPDSPAGRLKAAQPSETVVYSGSAGEVTKRCDVQDYDLPAHANRGELLDFVGQVSPHTVLLGYGDANSRQWSAQQIRARHSKIKVLQPGPDDSVWGSANTSSCRRSQSGSGEETQANHRRPKHGRSRNYDAKHHARLEQSAQQQRAKRRSKDAERSDRAFRRVERFHAIDLRPKRRHHRAGDALAHTDENQIHERNPQR
jgi:hypothetical protein